MNRQELIQQLAIEQNIPRPVARLCVDRFFDMIAMTLSRGERVEIRGLCTMKTKEYPGYTGRNPKTGKMVAVKSKKLPVFKMGTELKWRVDGLDAIEDIELGRIIEQRKNEKDEAIEIDIADL